MDRNSIVGLVIIGLIFFGFTIYSSKQQQAVALEKARIDSIARIEVAKTNAALALTPTADSLTRPDSTQALPVKEQLQKEMYGDSLYMAMKGEERAYVLENDKVSVSVSNKGGIIKSVRLKEYKTYNNEPLEMMQPGSAKFNIGLFTTGQINTSAFYFQTDAPERTEVSQGEASSLSMRLYFASDAYIEYLYTLKAESYSLDYQVRFVGMEGIISPAQRDFAISWANVSPQQERGYSYENQYTTIAYNHPNASDIEELNGMSDKPQEEVINTKIEWVAFKQQFFSSILQSKSGFNNGVVRQNSMPEHSGSIKAFSTELSVPYSPDQTSYDFSYYFGPNSYTTLNDYGSNYQKLIPLGWGIFGWVNRFIVIPSFNFLGQYMTNYGWIILLLTIFIKLLIFPFTYKSYLSMAKMRLLKPELDEINTKYPSKEDMMKKQQAMMELYRRAGVSPMGGCLPMLFQLPVLIAMFRFFPASIELRGEHFLWANDLSSYDSILQLPFTIPFYGDHVSLFALLMGVSLYVSTKINYAQNSAASSTQMPGMTFMTLYLMPVMMILWFNNYSSGLSYYYLLSNLITIGQSLIIRRFVSDDKLHRQMKDNAKKPRKKNKFQERYDQMLKQQQEMARQGQKQQTKKK